MWILIVLGAVCIYLGGCILTTISYVKFFDKYVWESEDGTDDGKCSEAVLRGDRPRDKYADCETVLWPILWPLWVPPILGIGLLCCLLLPFIGLVVCIEKLVSTDRYKVA